MECEKELSPSDKGIEKKLPPVDTAYHHGDVKQAAIMATMALVAEAGRQAISMRKVADFVGVTHRALYRHFEGLEDLLLQVSVLAFDRLRQRIDREAKPGVEGIVHAYLEFALEDKHLYELAFSNRMTTLNNNPYTARIITSLLSTVRKKYAENPVKGKKKLSDDEAIIKLWATLHGLVDLSARGILKNRNHKELMDFVTKLVGEP